MAPWDGVSPLFYGFVTGQVQGFMVSETGWSKDLWFRDGFGPRIYGSGTGLVQGIVPRRVWSKEIYGFGTGLLQGFMVPGRVWSKVLFRDGFAPKIYGSGTDLLQGFMVPGRVWSKVLFRDGFAQGDLIFSGLTGENIMNKRKYFKKRPLPLLTTINCPLPLLTTINCPLPANNNKLSSPC